MKTPAVLRKLLVGTLAFLLVVLISNPAPAAACAVCFGAKDSNTTASMAIAIWFLMGAVMTVLGGVLAFAFYLWRRASTPLSADAELAEEVSELTEAYD